MRISLEVYDSKVKIKPVLQNDRLIMEIAANLEFSVCELGGSENYLEKDLRDMLANHMTAMLESRILALVQKTKDSYSTDIFGFDQAIKSAMPDYWKANREDWDTIYKGLQIIPKVKVTLVLSANTSDTIAIN
ncbi:hypothetical protein SDC9_154756 [bioreactor metagenome]|uniref:Spore germination GerAC-like C-terminal domain-containing protein n=1 Tax=bioreactor metagenome TaxID=1076179 RepID=A0A645F1E0_9ZZZZ